MTDHIDPRPGWIRQRTYELQQTGLKYSTARTQAEADADDRFRPEDDGGGNGGAA
jgi:hypothetical protein